MNDNETRYRFDSADGATIVSLGPGLNDAPWTEFEKLGEELLGRLEAIRSPALLVDLSALSYMGSAMVAQIVRFWKWTQERDGQMVVVNQHEMIDEILSISGLKRIWTIVETQEEGLAELGVRPASSRGAVLMLVEVLAVLGAVVGVCLLWEPVARIVHVPSRIALLAGCGFAILGLIAGTVGTLRQTGGRRGFAIFVVTASVLVLLAGVLTVPPLRGVVPGPVKHVLPKENPAGEDGAEQKEENKANNGQPADDRPPQADDNHTGSLKPGFLERTRLAELADVLPIRPQDLLS